MTVLYEYSVGFPPVRWLAIFLFCVGALLMIAAIAVIWMDIYDKEFNWPEFAALSVGALFILAGMEIDKDTRHLEVKAIINETVPWVEVNDKYELLKQEGDIYTFRVRDDATE